MPHGTGEQSRINNIWLSSLVSGTNPANARMSDRLRRRIKWLKKNRNW